MIVTTFVFFLLFLVLLFLLLTFLVFLSFSVFITRLFTFIILTFFVCTFLFLLNIKQDQILEKTSKHILQFYLYRAEQFIQYFIGVFDRLAIFQSIFNT